jgi:hypothetical protein
LVTIWNGGFPKFFLILGTSTIVRTEKAQVLQILNGLIFTLVANDSTIWHKHSSEFYYVKKVDIIFEVLEG